MNSQSTYTYVRICITVTIFFTWLFKFYGTDIIQKWTDPDLKIKSQYDGDDGGFVEVDVDSYNSTLSIGARKNNTDIEDDTVSTMNTLSHGNNSSNNSKLDFAIIGFAKCGTSFLMKDVLNIPQINFGNDPDQLPHESKFVRDRDIEGINQMLKASSNTTRRVLNGVKEPNILTRNGSLQFFKKHFKGTKLIVTVRHPVWRFQSAYNFFILRRFDYQHDASKRPPSPNDFIGDCGYYCNEDCVAQNQKAICTNEFNVHHFLSRLRWTSMDTEEEVSLLGHEDMQKKRLPNDMFLMDLEQMSDSDNQRKQKFERGLEQFLELERDSISIGDHRKQKRDTDTFDICRSEYQELREELVIIGKNASKWIREYFLKSSRVEVVNRDHFLEIIGKWGHDPCDETNHIHT